MLIVFEGIDGAGKETQIARLLSFLRQHKVKFKLHKYPTSGAREALAHLAGRTTLPPMQLAGVFADDIMEEKGKVEGEISSGFAVICDRYFHSTLAYQGVGAGYGEVKAQLEKCGAIVPDIVVLLDIDATAGVRRKGAQKHPDRHEGDPEFLDKVRENYLRMEKEHFLAYKYALVDAGRPADEVFSEVITQVEPLLTKKIEK